MKTINSNSHALDAMDMHVRREELRMIEEDIASAHHLNDPNLPEIMAYYREQLALYEDLRTEHKNGNGQW